MSTGTQIALAAVAVLGVVLVALGTRRKPPPPVREISPAGSALARELMADGKLVQAVRVVRTETGLGLREAKEYAESLGATGEPPVPRPVDGVDEETRTRARALVRDGKPVMAVKVVRDGTGWSLRQAKEFVDGLR
jgi:ribosomal protein L7/L12